MSAGLSYDKVISQIQSPVLTPGHNVPMIHNSFVDFGAVFIVRLFTWFPYLLPFSLLIFPCLSENRPALFPGRSSQEVTKPGLKLFQSVLHAYFVL